MATPSPSTRAHEWKTYRERSQYTVTYKYDRRGPYGNRFVSITPQTEKYLFNKGTAIDYEDMQKTIEESTKIVVGAVTARRIRNFIIAGLSIIVVLIGIVMFVLAIVFSDSMGTGGYYALLIIGIIIAVVGCIIFGILSFLVGLYEKKNGPLQKAKKFLEMESIKKYTDMLLFQVDRFYDQYQEWRTRKIPIGRANPNNPQSPMRYRTERYIATVKYPVYYIHVTNKYPPKPEQEQDPDFFQKIPNLKESWLVPLPTFNAPPPVSNNQVMPMQQQQMSMQQQMPVQQQMPMGGMAMGGQMPVQQQMPMGSQMPMGGQPQMAMGSQMPPGNMQYNQNIH